MHKANFNKDITGYELLLIFAESDGDFDPREGNVIVDFIQKKFPLGGNLDAVVEHVSRIPKEDYLNRVEELAADFYAESTEEERKEFLHFALDLVKADEHLAKEENLLISKLFVAWDI
ncbi:MAG: hypothetical protein GC181_07585 [Bacteroidetes bacterium]|nr:hypothetical protein [Bacteroidota bacterium]